MIPPELSEGPTSSCSGCWASQASREHRYAPLADGDKPGEEGLWGKLHWLVGLPVPEARDLVGVSLRETAVRIEGERKQLPRECLRGRVPRGASLF